jgi:hypothetical protein
MEKKLEDSYLRVKAIVNLWIRGAFLWMGVAMAVFAGVVLAGVYLVGEFRGPGPDWNIQRGFSQPTGDPAESARRSAFGALPSTGHILWGSSFNENIAEVDTSGAAPRAIVEWSEGQAHSGPGSLHILTGNVKYDYADFRRLAFAQTQSRIGIAMHIWPEIDIISIAQQEIYLSLEMNFRGMSDHDLYINAGINIYRDNIGGTEIYYQDATGAYVLIPGVAISPFFISSADAWSYTYWRFLKFAVDTSGPIPKYAYLDLDGRRYDLSALTPRYTVPPAAPNLDQSFIFVAFSLTTYQAGAPAGAFIDDAALTDREP